MARQSGGKSLRPQKKLIRRRSWPAVLGLLTLAADRASNAATIRADVPDSSYTARSAQSQYASSGYVDVVTSSGQEFGSATLIAPDWVLTAAHVVTVDSSGPAYPASEVSFGQGATAIVFKTAPDSVNQVDIESGWDGNLAAGDDLALLQLSTPITNVTPATLYPSSLGSELGQVATIVGYGLTGTGLTGDIANTAGTRQAIQNVMDNLGGDTTTGGPPNNYKYSFAGISTNVMLSDFDEPNLPGTSVMGGSTPEPLEGASTFGDSGGGVFLTENGQTYLAGVTDFIGAFSTNALSTTADGHYGDYNGYMRIAVPQSMSFITSTLVTTSAWSPSGGGTWASISNWTGGNIPEFAGATANLGATTTSPTITLDANWTVGTLNFNNVNSYTLAPGNGGTLTLDNGGLTATAVINDNGGRHFITAPVILNSTAQVTVVNMPDVLTISGPISGNGGLVMNGAGTLVLSGSNSYLGGTTITAGVVQSGNANSLGSGVLTLTSGTLDLNGISTTVGGLAGMGVVDNVSAGGTPVLAINSAVNTTFSGVIQNTTGMVSLTKTGSGTQVLAGANAYGGSTTINGGAVVFASTASIGGAGASITVNSGGAVGFLPGITTPAFLAAINPASTGALALTGADAATNLDFTSAPLSGLAGMSVGATGNVTYTGIYTPAGSTYLLGGGGGTLTYLPGISGNVSVQIGNADSSGMVILSAANSYSGPTTIAGGALAIGSDAAVSNGSGGIDFAGGTLEFENYTSNLSFSGQPMLSLAAATGAASVLNGSISDGGNGTTALTYVGAGTLVLAANNTFSGGVAIEAGVLQLGNGGAAGSAGSGPILDNTSLVIDRSDSALVLNNPISGSGSVALTGVGTVTFAAVNSYTGGLTISSGKLAVGNSAALGNPWNAVTVNGTLDLDGFSPSIGALTGAGTIDNGMASVLSTLTACGGNAGSTFSGAIQNGGGTVRLIKAGTGTLILSGANTFSGGTTIQAGTLQLGSGSNTGSAGSGPITDSGELVIDRSDASLAFGNSISGSGSVTVDGSGTVTLTAVNTYTGGTMVNAGKLAVGNSAALGSVSDALTVYATLDLAGFSPSVGALSGYGVIDNSAASVPSILSVGYGNASSTFSGIVQNGAGTAGLLQAGYGTLSLTGANTYSGGTTIQSGVLQLGGGGTVGSAGSGPIVDNSLLTIDRGDTSLAFTNPISGTGSVKLVGTGTVTFGAVNTYSGSTTVSAGWLIVSAAGALPSDGSVVNNSNFSVRAGTNTAPVIAGNVSGAGTLWVGTSTTSAVLQLAPNSGTSQQSLLKIHSGSSLDLTNNTLAINYGSSANDPIATIQANLDSGYSAGHWNGTGLISSSAAAGSTVHDLGYADADNPADLAGVSPSAGLQPNEILVKYTLAGDANLDGSVGFPDLALVAQNFGKSGKDWVQGDFNYDGVVNFQDLGLIAQNFGRTVTSTQFAQLPGSFAAMWQLAVSQSRTTVPVPEPCGSGLIMLACTCLLARRRRSAKPHP